MKTVIPTILVLTLSLAGCSAMLDFKDYEDPGVCGDGDVQSPEVCDNGDNNGMYGYCNADCTAMGPHCGDNVLQSAEEDCDGADIPEDCFGLGYTSGTVGCTESCVYNLDGCESPPGCSALGDLTCESGPVMGSTTLVGSGDGINTHCKNFGAIYTEREVTYAFTPLVRQQVEIQLTGLSADLDVFVYADDGSKCQDRDCVGASVAFGFQDEVARFIAEPPLSYFIVVDGVEGQSGAFELVLSCFGDEICDNLEDDNGDLLEDCAAPECAKTSECIGRTEVACNDGFDNDGAGGLDCADATCDSMPHCSCAPTQAQTIGCTDAFWSSNAAAGSTNQVNGAWCGGPWGGTFGPEQIYEIDTSGAAGNVLITLTGLTADVDAFVLRSNDGSCGVTSCVDDSLAENGLVDEHIEFTPAVGSTYFLAVDGWKWAKADYFITVECP